MSTRSGWESRVFRWWLTRTSPKLHATAVDDIVRLFEDRVSAEARGPISRLTLLVRAMIDAHHSSRGLRDLPARYRAPISRRARLSEALAATWRDIRFGARSLRKRPAFTLVAIGTLGLGIGGSTAVFTVVDGVLIKQFPYEDPETIVNVWKAWPSWQGREGLDYTWDRIQFPWVDFVGLRDNARAFTEVAAHAQATTVITEGGPTEELSVGEASGNLFSTLGAQFVVGRSFSSDETAPEADPLPVAILSHQLWDRRFGRDPGVIGTSVRLNNATYEVVGVLSEDFRLGSELIGTHDLGGVDPGLRDIWLPLGTNGTDRGNSFEVIARLAPGWTPDQARDEVQTLMLDHEIHDDQVALVQPRQLASRAGFHTPLGVLMAGAGLLMVIACANVSGLLLGETTNRRREMAVRAALGAHRKRIIRQLVTESILVGLAGSVLGVGLAWLTTDLLVAAGPTLPNAEHIRVDQRVLGFATAAGVATGLLFGMLPALDLSRSNTAARLRARGVERRTRLLQARIVAGQIGLTIVLLVAAGLSARSLDALFSVEPGFEAEGAYAFSIGAPVEGLGTDQSVFQYVEDLLTAVRNTPGVAAASVSNRLPFASAIGTQGFSFIREGEEPRSSSQLPMVVHPSYFETVGVELLQGRLLDSRDAEGAPRSMVVSRSWAEEYFDGESPVGTPVRYRGQEYDWTIVGVVEDVRHQALGLPPEPTFYMTSLQQPRLDYMLIVRSSDLGDSQLVAVRQAIASVSEDAPVAEAGSLKGLMRDSEADDRFRALILGAFAVLASALAVVGVFGVTGRTVAARGRELGVRVALGARLHSLKLMVLRDALANSLLGILVGLIAAAAVAQWLVPLLYEVSAFDPLVYLAAATVALLASLAAAYLPAARISRIDPSAVMAEE